VVCIEVRDGASFADIQEAIRQAEEQGFADGLRVSCEAGMAIVFDENQPGDPDGLGLGLGGGELSTKDQFIRRPIDGHDDADLLANRSACGSRTSSRSKTGTAASSPRAVPDGQANALPTGSSNGTGPHVLHGGRSDQRTPDRRWYENDEVNCKKKPEVVIGGVVQRARSEDSSWSVDCEEEVALDELESTGFLGIGDTFRGFVEVGSLDAPCPIQPASEPLPDIDKEVLSKQQNVPLHNAMPMGEPFDFEPSAPALRSASCPASARHGEELPSNCDAKRPASAQRVIKKREAEKFARAVEAYLVGSC
jgi:hypothetical protein